MPHPNCTKDEVRDIFTSFGISDDILVLCELVEQEADLAPIVDGEKVIGELTEEERKFALLLQCVGKEMILKEIHPLAAIILAEEFWKKLREGHNLGSHPIGVRENGKIVELVSHCLKFCGRRTVMSERKSLRKWVEDIGSSGLLDIIATKFPGETWETEFDFEGASEVLDDILSDLNLPPLGAIIKEEHA